MACPAASPSQKYLQRIIDTLMARVGDGPLKDGQSSREAAGKLPVMQAQEASSEGMLRPRQPASSVNNVLYLLLASNCTGDGRSGMISWPASQGGLLKRTASSSAAL